MSIRLWLSLAVLVIAGLMGHAQDPFGDEFKALPRELPKDLPPAKVDPKAKPPAVPEVSDTTKILVELVELKATVAPVKVRRGETIRVTIKGTTKPYVHTYTAVQKDKSRTLIKYGGVEGLQPLQPVTESEPHKEIDAGETRWVQRGEFEWKQDLYVTPDAKPGQHSIDVLVRLQVCTEDQGEGKTKKGGMCYIHSPYAPLKIAFDVDDAPAVAPSADVTKRFSMPPPGDAVAGNIDFDDLGGLLLAAFGGALLMLLTPCVFPMIPITVNFFIKQSEKEHHRPYFMASVYAGSIVVLLSVVMLVAGKAVIDLALDPWFNLGMGAVLVLFAVGLFGLFEVDLSKFGGMVVFMLVGYLLATLTKRIFGPDPVGGEFRLAAICLLLALPALYVLNRVVHQVAMLLGFEGWSLVNFLSHQEARGGALGAAFMAMTFTVTSFSCTGPFLGIMLAPIAKAQPPVRNLVLAALVYSVTFAAPFFVLALFPTWLKKLPKSGGWMTTIKVTMGFLEIGAALKFLSNTDLAWFPGNPRLFNYDTVLCAWIALAFACALYLFSLIKLDHDDPEPQIGPVRMVFGCLFLGLSFYLLPLLFGMTPKGVVMEGLISFLPLNLDTTRGQSGTGGQEAAPFIHDDYPEAWEVAKKQNKLIFIDFTGQNCANCRENERNVFPNREVIAALKNYVCVKIFTDIVPDPKLKPAEAQAKAQEQLKYQTSLGLGFAQPTYAIVQPDRQQPFEGEGLKARLIDKRDGKIFDVPDFIRFLQEPAKANPPTELRAEAGGPR